MSTVEDILFAPIIPREIDQQLRDLVKKIMATEPNDKLSVSVANQIVELFARYGIRDEQEIVDAVHRISKDLSGNLYITEALAIS